jgi:hypothetical protein
METGNHVLCRRQKERPHTDDRFCGFVRFRPWTGSRVLPGDFPRWTIYMPVGRALGGDGGAAAAAAAANRNQQADPTFPGSGLKRTAFFSPVRPTGPDLPASRRGLYAELGHRQTLTSRTTQAFPLGMWAEFRVSRRRLFAGRRQLIGQAFA